MDFVVENGDEVYEKVSFESFPGHLVKDLLSAMNRGKKKDGASGSTITNKLNSMRISELRRELHVRGLDVDGSRETMIATLKPAVIPKDIDDITLDM